MLLWDAGLWRHGVATPLLLGYIILICERLLLLDRLWHVSRVHLRVALGHASARLLLLLLWGEVLWTRLLWRLDGTCVVNAVLTTAGGFRSVQACLLS